MNEQDKLIAEQIKTLPLELQRAIESVPWRNLVKEIGSANNLNAGQQESFDQETMFIIYAFEDPRNYIANLKREVGIDDVKANILANTVAERILNPINEKSKDGAPVSKNDIKQELIQRREVATGVAKPSSNIPEIAPEIHPSTSLETGPVTKPTSEPIVILKKEDKPASQAKPAETKVSLPDYRYPGGKDPYREPMV